LNGRSGRSHAGVNEHVVFQRIDTNQDNKLSKDETLRYLGKLNAAEFKFSEYDINVDGYLSEAEIESGKHI
jgi:Ca2+-binding EF-hand superfamily protein